MLPSESSASTTTVSPPSSLSSVPGNKDSKLNVGGTLGAVTEMVVLIS